MMRENLQKPNIANGSLLRCVLIFLAVSLWAPPASWTDFNEGLAARDQGDYTTALRHWRPLAEQGEAAAQDELGWMYHKGYGVHRNDTEAVKWFRKAAEQGHVDGQYHLGWMYKEGRGVRQNGEAAVLWLRKAAEQGHELAQRSLGMVYYFGLGVRQNYAQALQWFRKAAEQGDTIAQLNLGAMYTNGQGVRRDYVTAYVWSTLAAARGDDTAVKNRKGIAKVLTSAQIAEAERRARNWKPRKEQIASNSKPNPQRKESATSSGSRLSSAAASRSRALSSAAASQSRALSSAAASQSRIRTSTINSRRNESSTPRADFSEGLAAYNRRDYTTALRHWQPLAARGNTEAQYNLGVMYRYGYGVDKKDYVEAVKWYRKAAEQGLCHSPQYNLGCYVSKRLGALIKRTIAEAVKWYRKAAEQGYATAQSNLGVMYRYGYGVTKDYVEAYVWYTLAATGGNPNASTNRNSIAKLMTPSQIAEAERRARNWKPRDKETETPSVARQKPVTPPPTSTQRQNLRLHLLLPYLPFSLSRTLRSQKARWMQTKPQPSLSVSKTWDPATHAT